MRWHLSKPDNTPHRICSSFFETSAKPPSRFVPDASLHKCCAIHDFVDPKNSIVASCLDTSFEDPKHVAANIAHHAAHPITHPHKRFLENGRASETPDGLMTRAGIALKWPLRTLTTTLDL